MLAHRWMNDASSLDSDEEPPLVRAMREMARVLAHRIVVRSPLEQRFSPEITRAGEHGPVHEVVTRVGVRVRGPFALLRRPQRPVLVRVDAEAEGRASRA